MPDGRGEAAREKATWLVPDPARSHQVRRAFRLKTGFGCAQRSSDQDRRAARAGPKLPLQAPPQPGQLGPPPLVGNLEATLEPVH